MRIVCLISLVLLAAVCNNPTEARDRIRAAPPTPAEEARLASEMAMNDGLLQKGDIVVTDRGFFLFQGVGEDGYTNEFVPIENPLSSNAAGFRRDGRRRWP